MVPKDDLDYVELYANKLKRNNSLFKQQKRLIESQLHSSSELFKNRFGSGKKFKVHARAYLRKLDLI